MKAPITLMAIDPGYDRVGWAIGVLQGTQLHQVAYGLIQTSPKDSLVSRYQQIDTELTALVVKYQPTEAAIESLFFYNNKSTAIHVAEARGVIISTFFRHQMKVAEYTPLQIKQAVTGFGQADKKAVEKMVMLQLKKFLTPTNDKIIDDTLDALACLLTHATSRSSTMKSL